MWWHKTPNTQARCALRYFKYRGKNAAFSAASRKKRQGDNISWLGMRACACTWTHARHITVLLATKLGQKDSFFYLQSNSNVQKKGGNDFPSVVFTSWWWNLKFAVEPELYQKKNVTVSGKITNGKWSSSNIMYELQLSIRHMTSRL